MSVINIIRQTNAIHIVTDGLATGPDGRMFTTDKAVPLPALNAVAAVRGQGVAPHFLAGAIAMRCGSRSDIETKGVDAVRELTNALPGCQFDLVIAGWDDGGKFNYGISSNDGVFDGPAWKVISLPTNNTITPLPFRPEWVPEWQKIVPPRTDPNKMNVGHAAVELVKMQRRMETDGRSHIGCFVSLATVTKKGITARIVKRFPEHLKGDN